MNIFTNLTPWISNLGTLISTLGISNLGAFISILAFWSSIAPIDGKLSWISTLGIGTLIYGVFILGSWISNPGTLISTLGVSIFGALLLISVFPSNIAPIDGKLPWIFNPASSFGPWISNDGTSILGPWIANDGTSILGP